MTRTPAQSAAAGEALALVEDLQDHFAAALTRVAADGTKFEPVEWLRDEGRHGGGVRRVATPGRFDRASLNVSQVHYDDMPDKKLASATALSCIVHPSAPLAPSLHMHISWTEMRDGKGYWRVMADLNPSNPNDADRETFERSLRDAAQEHYEAGAAQGDRYFYIPALERHRGVSHFYLEAFDTGDRDADQALAQHVGVSTIDTYAEILARAFQRDADDEAKTRQREYHTVYLFQVLTLDRGTTSGLLVHDQNDVGILGSLPSHVDGELLASWIDRMPAPQVGLLRTLVEVIGNAPSVEIDEAKKRALAAAVRAHYQRNPQALSLQASGDVVPPTVANHR